MKPQPKQTAKSGAKKPDAKDSSDEAKTSDDKTPAGKSAAGSRKGKPAAGGLPAQIAGIPTKHIISGVITVVIGIVLVLILNWWNSEKYIDDRLPAIAKAWNKSRPVQAATKQPHDEDIVAGPGNVMTFKHVYADRLAKSFPMPAFTKQMTDFHRKEYKESKMYAELRDNNVEVRHVYLDMENKPIVTIKLTPKDL